MKLPDGTPTLYELLQYALNILHSWILVLKAFWLYIAGIIIIIIVFVVVLDLLGIKFGHEPKRFDKD